VIANLEHRHSYVRKNAVLALTAIFNLPKGELLVPDAPELVERMLQNEQVGCGVWAAVMCLWWYRQAGSRAGAVVALCRGWRMAPLWHLWVALHRVLLTTLLSLTDHSRPPTSWHVSAPVCRT
jgi:hypothetical protein